MSAAILCVGALALDTIFRLDALPTAPGKYLPTEAFEVVEAMATAQAATIARLGGRARLWASCGDDAVGDRMVRELAEAGVDAGAIRRVPGARSGFSTILMDRAGERIIVPQYDPAIRSTPVEPPPMDDIGVVSVDVRWPAAAEIALRAARERGIPGILDLEVAPREVVDRLIPLASHIVASEQGAQAVTAMSPEAAVRALGMRTDAFVAVTAGERGTYWRGGHVPAFPVDVVDTLAAGDVFHGAFAFGLAEGWNEPTSLRFAAAAAAIKCTRLGGRLGAPTRHEVEAMLGAG
jgi:sulfofructose kinase